MIGKSILSHVMKIVNNVFQKTFQSNTKRVLNKKLQNFNKKIIFGDEDMSKHFAHAETTNIASQYVLKGFIIDRIQFIENNLSHESIKSDSFIDIGDSDGIFLKALGKKGYSANISKVAVKMNHDKGMESIQCNAENIPIKSNSVDHILFFEIFEHLPNPIMALQELYRVCNKTVIISIPHMSRTNIHKYCYDPNRFLPEHHIFEFDIVDFKKIVSHSKFKIENMETFEVIDKGTFKERFVFFIYRILAFRNKDSEYSNNLQDLYCGCFKKFDVYLLKKS